MLTNISYLSLLVTLIGAVLGLTGSAWDTKKTGMLKFTRRGGISLAILLIGFSLSAITTYKANVNSENERRRNDYERQQRLLVKHLAYKEIGNSVSRMSAPFLDMYIANGGDLPILGNKMFEVFASDKAMRLFTSSSFIDKRQDDITGSEKYDSSYARSIKRVFDTESAELTEIVKTFSYYLDGEDIVLLNSIVSDPYVSDLRNLFDREKLGVELTYPFNSIKENDHKGFFMKLAKLWAKINIDNDSPLSRDVIKREPKAMPTNVGTPLTKIAPKE